MAQRLQLKVSNKTKISPGLQNSLKLIALNTIELIDEINGWLEENPFIEEDRKPKKDSTGKSELIEEAQVHKVTLFDFLNEQIQHYSEKIDSQALQFLRLIISSLTQQGLSVDTHKKMAIENNIHTKYIRPAINILKELDPIGIGAETIWQSLTWQAEKKYPDDRILVDIIPLLEGAEEKISKIKSSHITELAEALGTETRKIEKSIARLATLDPYPGREFYQVHSNYVYPDIIFSEDEQGNYKIQVQNDYLPELSINQNLYQQFKDTDEKNETWRNKFYEAKNLLNAIEYRTNALQKVAQSILIKQIDFFAKGPQYIRPMNLEDVAKDIKLHISTVSRIVSHKYCQSKWGVFPIKFFFPAKIRSNNGSLLGTEDLRREILATIAQEPLGKPLSDEQLKIILHKKGFDVQRRTVAKYRKLLHIPTSRERK